MSDQNFIDNIDLKEMLACERARVIELRAEINNLKNCIHEIASIAKTTARSSPYPTGTAAKILAIAEGLI